MEMDSELSLTQANDNAAGVTVMVTIPSSPPTFFKFPSGEDNTDPRLLSVVETCDERDASRIFQPNMPDDSKDGQSNTTPEQNDQDEAASGSTSVSHPSAFSGPSNLGTDLAPNATETQIGEPSGRTPPPSTAQTNLRNSASENLNKINNSPQPDVGEDAAEQPSSVPPINPSTVVAASYPEFPMVQDDRTDLAVERANINAVDPSVAEDLGQATSIEAEVPPPAAISNTEDPEPLHNPPLPPNYPPIIYPSVVPDDHMHIDETRNTSIPKDTEVIELGTDDDDSMEDDEDASSEVSDGDDLKGDLESALEGDFDFKGNFAFSTSLPHAPNPGLHIDPLGLIGLPLSPRDALLIKNCAVQAPFGHGERTVVDKEVRDTWEIEPGKVRFGNLEWSAFVTGDVVRKTCAELGVSVQASMPRCELYKLLLYETGSHFLPHQDTEKSPGMFATIVIVLPSLYTGGQVHVSHGASSRVYDLAPSSAFTTSALSWYTDVMHEVKPITSGYRLALSYNLIHTSQGIPRPMLPDMHSAVTNLKSVLRRWGKGGYDCAQDTPQIVAYLLKHQYSEVNLKAGALKGEDAHKISHLRTVAEEFGIAVCLANLSCNVTGVPDDDGCGYYGGYGGRKRYRYGYGDDDSEDSDERETPSMMEEIDRSMTISNLVDLHGNALMSGKEIGLEDDSLIPENPFEGAAPDEKEYEGYMGNGAGTLEYWYKRTVLVLFREEDELDILLNAGGIAYALQTLIRTGAGTRQRTTDDLRRVNYILSRLSPNDKTTARAMADFAVQWGDSDMWKKVVKGSGAEKNVDVLEKDHLIRAWKKFSFEFVRSTLEEILTNTATLKAKLDFTTSLQLEATGDDVDIIARWCHEQTSRALASLKTPTKGDVPILISVLLGKGFAFLPDVILPQLVKMPSIYEFWVEFITSLHGHKNALLRPIKPNPTEENHRNTTTSGPDSDFEKVLERCLNAAIMQWNSVVAQPRQVYSYSTYGNQALPSQSRVTRITKLVDLCITTGRLVPCDRLFALVIKSKEDNPLLAKFQKLYNPLITELKKLLSGRGVDITSPPFGLFFRLLVGSYLQGILGAKGRHVQEATIPKFGCGCGPCMDLDRFMVSTGAEYTFRYNQTQRRHLENRLTSAAARALVTFKTIRTGTPHGLVVTKKPEVVAATQWSYRRKEAKIFLSSIGNDTVISKLMGPRHPDVVKSLEGVQQFVVAANDYLARPQPLAPSNAANAPQASTSTTVVAAIPPPAEPVVTKATANKRKRTGPPPIILGPVIDLTGDDSS